MPTLVDKIIPKFPAQVLAGDGILITQTGGVYTIEVDPAVLPDLTAQIDVAHGGTGQDFSGSSGILLYTSGVASLLASTGTGNVVRAASPILTTPNIGAAVAGSINGNVITTSTGTLTLGAGKTATISNTLTFSGTDGSTAAFGTGGTVVYTSNKLSVHAATTSAELAGVISDETGSGALVFATSPTLVTPTIGVATATTINGVALSNAAWTTSSPTITAVSGTYTSVSSAMRHIKIGRLVLFDVLITITTNGTAAGGAICPLPASLTSAGYFACTGFNTVTGLGLFGNIAQGGTTMSISKSGDGAYSGADGQFLAVSGFFEATT